MPKPSKSSGKRPAGRLPSKAEILAYLQEHPRELDKRQLARAFKLRGAERVALRDLLREMKREGLIEDQGRRRVSAAGRLPSVTVLRVTMLDEDGDLLARPVNAEENDAVPVIRLVPSSAKIAAPSPGRPGAGAPDAPGRRQLFGKDHSPLGTAGAPPPRPLRDDARGRPAEALRQEGPRRLSPDAENAADAEPGDLVLVEVLPKPRGRHMGPRSRARSRALRQLPGPKAPSASSPSTAMAFPPPSRRLQ